MLFATFSLKLACLWEERRQWSSCCAEGGKNPSAVQIWQPRCYQITKIIIYSWSGRLISWNKLLSVICKTASPIIAALKNNNTCKCSSIIENFGENGSFAVNKTSEQPSQAPACVAYRSDHLSLSSSQLFYTGKFPPLLFTLVLSYIFSSLFFDFFFSPPLQALGVLFVYTLFLKIQCSWHHVKTIDIVIQWVVTY